MEKLEKGVASWPCLISCFLVGEYSFQTISGMAVE